MKPEPDFDAEVFGATFYVSELIWGQIGKLVVHGPRPDNPTFTLWVGKDHPWADGSPRRVRYVGTTILVDHSLEEGAVRLPSGHVVFPSRAAGEEVFGQDP